MAILGGGTSGGIGLTNYSRIVGGVTGSAGPIRAPRVDRYLPIPRAQFITPPPYVYSDIAIDWTSSTTVPAEIALTRSTNNNKYFNSSGVLSNASANTARFDYKWDGSNWVIGGLLVEEGRTNSCYNSDLTAWTNPGAGNTVTTATSLDGTSNAYTVTPSGSFGSHMTYLPGTHLTTANPVTYSCYVKANGYTKVAIRETVGSGTGYVFDLASGGSVIGSFNSNANLAVSAPLIETIGSGGWFRIQFRITPTGSQSLGLGCIVVDNSYSTGDPWASYTFAGNGTSGATFFIPQLEEGIGATSPVTTAGAGVARSADLLSSSDQNYIGLQGWIIEVGELETGIAATLLGINTFIGIGFDSTGHLTTTYGGTQTTSSTATVSAVNGGGIAFDGTPRVSISLDGSTVTTAANVVSPPTALYFGNTNNGASGFINGHIRKINGYDVLTDVDLASLTGNALHVVVAQTLDALTQTVTGTVIDTATVDQTLGALTQAATGTVSDSAVVAQTLGALVQVATDTVLAQATTTQTLGALGQAVTATNLDHAVVAQTLGALSQVATGTVIDAITVAQNLGALTQAAAATHPDTAAVAQTLGALVQTATAGVIDTATAAQTLGALAQAAIASAPAALTAAQTLGALGQTTTGNAIVAAVANQTLGALAQAATGTVTDTAAVAQILGALSQTVTAGVVDTASVNQALGALTQTATVTLTDALSITAAQTLGALAQALTGTVVDTATVAQTLGPLGQSVSLTHVDTATTAQTLGAIVQALTGAVIDNAAVNQALGALNQTATAVGSSGFIAAQTLGALVQALTGTVVDAVTVAQALGGLQQATSGGPVGRIAAYTDTLPALGQAATGGPVAKATVSQVLGALSQLATASVPQAEFIASQILGALEQVATSRVAQRSLADQVLGALGQTARISIVPTAHKFIPGIFGSHHEAVQGQFPLHEQIVQGAASRQTAKGAFRQRATIQGKFTLQ